MGHTTTRFPLTWLRWASTHFLRSLFVQKKLQYLAVYSIDPAISIASIRLDEYPGLLVLYRTTGGDKAQVFAHWETSDAYEAVTEALEQRLGATKEARGFVANPLLPTKRFWHISSLTDLLSKGSSAIGAWVVVSGAVLAAYHSAAAAPEARFVLSAPPNVRMGQDLAFELSWTNLSGVSTKPRGSFYLSNSSLGNQPLSAAGGLGELAPGSSNKVTLQGKAPSKIVAALSPPEFKLGGNVLMKAGWLSLERNFELEPRTVKVWPRLICPPNPEFIRVRGDGRLAQFREVIHTGQPFSNLRAEVQLHSMSLGMDVSLVGVGIPSLLAGDVGPQAVVTIGSAAEFTERAIEITLRSREQSVPNWRAKAQSVTIACE